MNESLGIDSFEPIQVVSVEKTWFLSNFKLGHHFLFQALKFSKLLEPFIKKIECLFLGESGYWAQLLELRWSLLP